VKFKGQLAAPRINLDAYRKKLREHMAEVIAQSAMQWLTTVLAEIPIWSGASQATFMPLAQKIGYALSVSPASGNWAHGLFKSRMDRVGLGQSAGHGDVKLDEPPGVYTFEYSTTLPWLIWNEYHNANVDPDPTLFYRVLKEGPYNFQDKGKQAFKDSARDVRLPDLSGCLKITRIRVS
jgi:hypothetical protein